MTLPPNLLPPLRPLWGHWNAGRRLSIGQTVRGAKLVPWRISAEEATLERLRAEMNPSVGGRWVPEGRYTMLKLKGEDDEGNEHWRTVMSDTPDEMNDHAEPLLYATGRVLVHGLGLGCVLNCLFHKPDVTHIDVVEINADVIDVVTPLHRTFGWDRKVTIHHGSCVDIKWPRGSRWNYVWHDIWSDISDDNLTDDGKAEHGISYARLHRMFGGRCDRQGSWALREARWCREVERTQEVLATELARWWNAQSPEAREHFLLAREAATVGIGPEEYRPFAEGAGRLAEWARMAARGLRVSDAKWFVLDEARQSVFRRKRRSDQAIVRRFEQSQAAL